MTKKSVAYIFKRCSFIRDAINKGEEVAVFYVGKRKETVIITEEVITVCKIIDEIYNNSDNWIKLLIDGLRKGYSDIALIHMLPWEKNAYYERKRKLIEKIYNCCIYKNMVEYEDILSEEI